MRRKILLWKRADLNAIRQRIKEWSTQFTSEFSTTTPVEDLAEAIHHELLHVIDTMYPLNKAQTDSANPGLIPTPSMPLDAKQGPTGKLVELTEIRTGPASDA